MLLAFHERDVGEPSYVLLAWSSIGADRSNPWYAKSSLVFVSIETMAP